MIFEIPEGYRLAQQPEDPTHVKLDFLIREIINVNDHENSIEFEGDLTLVWKDERLILNDTYFEDHERANIDLAYRQTLWTPDIWINHLRSLSTYSITGDLASFTINSTNYLKLWQSISLTTSCKMDFNMYPFDVQQCYLLISTNGLDTRFQTFSGSIIKSDDISYSQGAMMYTEPELKMNPSYESDDWADPNIKWPQVKAYLRFQRKKMDYILWNFLPAGTLVCLTWISFLIPPHIVPGRMVLLVTILLVILDAYQRETQVSPKSTGLKSIDKWFLGCMTFVIAAICEYALLLYLKRHVIESDSWSKDMKKMAKKSCWDYIFMIFCGIGQDSFSKRKAQRKEQREYAEKIKEMVNNSNSENENYMRRTSGSKLHPPNSYSPPPSPVPSGLYQRPVTPTPPNHKPKKLELDTGSASYGDNDGSHLPTANENAHLVTEKIDSACIKLFPLAFVVFNIFYWAINLN